MSNILHSLLEDSLLEDSPYKTIHRLNLLSVINQCKHFFKKDADPSYDLLHSVDKDNSSGFVNENISKHVTGTKIIGLLTSPYKLNITSSVCVRKINNLLSKYAQSVTMTTKIKVNKNLTVNTNSSKIIEVMLFNNHNIYTDDKNITAFLNPDKSLYLITYSDNAGYSLIDYTLPDTFDKTITNYDPKKHFVFMNFYKSDNENELSETIIVEKNDTTYNFYKLKPAVSVPPSVPVQEEDKTQDELNRIFYDKCFSQLSTKTKTDPVVLFSITHDKLVSLEPDSIMSYLTNFNSSDNDVIYNILFQTNDTKLHVDIKGIYESIIESEYQDNKVQYRNDIFLMNLMNVKDFYTPPAAAAVGRGGGGKHTIQIGGNGYDTIKDDIERHKKNMEDIENDFPDLNENGFYELVNNNDISVDTKIIYLKKKLVARTLVHSYVPSISKHDVLTELNFFIDFYNKSDETNNDADKEFILNYGKDLIYMYRNIFDINNEIVSIKNQYDLQPIVMKEQSNVDIDIDLAEYYNNENFNTLMNMDYSDYDNPQNTSAITPVVSASNYRNKRESNKSFIDTVSQIGNKIMGTGKQHGGRVVTVENVNTLKEYIKKHDKLLLVAEKLLFIPPPDDILYYGYPIKNRIEMYENLHIINAATHTDTSDIMLEVQMSVYVYHVKLLNLIINKLMRYIAVTSEPIVNTAAIISSNPAIEEVAKIRKFYAKEDTTTNDIVPYMPATDADTAAITEIAVKYGLNKNTNVTELSQHVIQYLFNHTDKLEDFFKIKDVEPLEDKIKRLFVLLSTNGYNRYFACINGICKVNPAIEDKTNEITNKIEDNLFIANLQDDIKLIKCNTTCSAPNPEVIYKQMAEKFNIDSELLIQIEQFLIEEKGESEYTGTTLDDICEYISYMFTENSNNALMWSYIFDLLRPYTYFGDSAPYSDKKFIVFDVKSEIVDNELQMLALKPNFMQTIKSELNSSNVGLFKYGILDDAEKMKLINCGSLVSAKQFMKCVEKVDYDKFKIMVRFMGKKYMELFDNDIARKYEVNHNSDKNEYEMRKKFRYDIIKTDIVVPDVQDNIQDNPKQKVYSDHDLIDTFKSILDLDHTDKETTMVQGRHLISQPNEYSGFNIGPNFSSGLIMKNVTDIYNDIFTVDEEDEMDILKNKILEIQKVYIIYRKFQSELFVSFSFAYFLHNYPHIAFTHDGSNEKPDFHCKEFYPGYSDSIDKPNIIKKMTQLYDSITKSVPGSKIIQVSFKSALYTLLKQRLTDQKDVIKINDDANKQQYLYEELQKIENKLEVEKEIIKNVEEYATNNEDPYPYKHFNFDNSGNYLFTNWFIDDHTDNAATGPGKSENGYDNYHLTFDTANMNLRIYEDIHTIKKNKYNEVFFACDKNILNDISYKLPYVSTDALNMSSDYIINYPYDKIHLETVNLSEFKNNTCSGSEKNYNFKTNIICTGEFNTDVGFSVDYIEPPEDTKTLKELQMNYNEMVRSLLKILEDNNKIQLTLDIWNSKFSDKIFEVIPSDPRFTLFYLDLYCGLDGVNEQTFGTSELIGTQYVKHDLFTSHTMSHYDTYNVYTKFINELISLYGDDDNIREYLINHSSELLTTIFDTLDDSVKTERYNKFFTTDFTDFMTVTDNKNVKELGGIFPTSNISDFNKDIITKMTDKDKTDGEQAVDTVIEAVDTVIEVATSAAETVEAVAEVATEVVQTFSSEGSKGGSSNLFFNPLTRKTGGRKTGRRNKTLKDRCPKDAE